MRKHLLYIICVISCCTLSCKDAKNTHDPPLPFVFKAMDADSISFAYQGPLNSPIPAGETLLHLFPGVKFAVLNGQLYPINYYYTERDFGVERAMSEAFKSDYPDYKDGYVIYNGIKKSIPSNLGEPVSYCPRAIRNITITASSQIFGLDSGEILNDHFIIEMGTMWNFCAFDYIVSADGIPVSTFSRTSTIEEYTSFHPLLRPLDFKFTERPEGLPLETKFYIEVEMLDGKIVRDSTHTIHIY